MHVQYGSSTCTYSVSSSNIHSVAWRKQFDSWPHHNFLDIIFINFLTICVGTNTQEIKNKYVNKLTNKYRFRQMGVGPCNIKYCMAFRLFLKDSNISQVSHLIYYYNNRQEYVSPKEIVINNCRMIINSCYTMINNCHMIIILSTQWLIVMVWW